MSRDWTPNELSAASAAMKAAGHMGYEEFCGELVRQGINLEVKHMKYKIFHTTSVKERFLSWDSAQRVGLHPEYYVRVYEGEISSDNMDDLPEELCRIFNTDPPADYRGRALSVSDIITVSDGDIQKSYFCDSIGFKEIEFIDTEPMDGFLADGMHWYLEKAGKSYDLFKQENIEADRYRLAHTGSYCECMAVLEYC